MSGALLCGALVPVLLFASSLTGVFAFLAACFVVGAGVFLPGGELVLGAAAVGLSGASLCGMPPFIGILVGAVLGILVTRSLGGTTLITRLAHFGWGLLLGAALLSCGAFLPIELVAGIIGTALFFFPFLQSLVAVLIGLMVFVFFALIRVNFSMPSSYFRFYNQVHATPLAFFSRPLSEDGESGLEFFRGPFDRFYLGTSRRWISDGGRFIEHPALGPTAFALRWMKLAGMKAPLTFEGAATPDLCSRYEPGAIDYIAQDGDRFERECRLKKWEAVKDVRHLMVFPPASLESADDLLSRSLAGGEWSEWICDYEPPTGPAGFLEATAPDSEPVGHQYRLKFTSLSCVVRLGKKVSGIEAFANDEVIGRYLTLGGQT